MGDRTATAGLVDSGQAVGMALGRFTTTRSLRRGWRRRTTAMHQAHPLSKTPTGQAATSQSIIGPRRSTVNPAKGHRRDRWPIRMAFVAFGLACSAGLDQFVGGRGMCHCRHHPTKLETATRWTGGGWSGSRRGVCSGCGAEMRLPGLARRRISHHLF